MPLQTVRHNKLEYLTAGNIGAPHGFTTRRGGVSQGIFGSMNLNLREGEEMSNVENNLRILANALDFDPKKLVLTQQIHSDTVRTVTASDHLGFYHRDYPECDALVTREPGTALMVFTADCTPILLWDSVTGAVGAAHAGWRGTAADIAGKTVAAMVALGSDPCHIHAAIGPNIGICCFETDAEVPLAMEDTFGPEIWKFVRQAENKYYVNLKEINALALGRAGVSSIEISEDCTMCQPHRFWSHRYTGGLRGSQGAVIVCKEVQP